MKKENLKNTKVYLCNKFDRALYNKKVLNLGIQLKDGFTMAKVNDCPFIYINEDYLLYAVENSEEAKTTFLNEDEFEQIFLDDVLSIVDYNFKPFDRVLVRDGEDDEWVASLFSHYGNDPIFPFVTINDNEWASCIPYEGNEELLIVKK